MSIFGKFKKRNKKENKQMVTVEEVKKLFEGLSETDKQLFLKDLNVEKEREQKEERSVEPAPQANSAQEAAKDEISASDAEPTPEKNELPAPETSANQTAIKAIEELSSLKEMIAELKKELAELKRNPAPANDKQATELDKLMARYNA